MTIDNNKQFGFKEESGYDIWPYKDYDDYTNNIDVKSELNMWSIWNLEYKKKQILDKMEKLLDKLLEILKDE